MSCLKDLFNNLLPIKKTKNLLQLRQVVAEKEEHEATSSGHQVLYRARIGKRLRSPGIDS